MTVPRRLVPGRTHAFVRRTSERRFFLRPSEAVNAILGYTLGRGLEGTQVSLHAFMAHLNHHHGVATDRRDRAELPVFLGGFHSLAARALNSHYRRGEALWRPGSYDNCELDDRDAIERQCVYTWLQPVKDGICRTADAWPGFKLMPEDFGKTFTFHLPKGAFFGGRRPAGRGSAGGGGGGERARQRRRNRDPRRRPRRDRRRRRACRRKRRKERAPRPEGRDRSRLPKTVTITVKPPPGYEDWPIKEVRKHFRALLVAAQEEVWAEMEAEGRTFSGVAAALALDPCSSPSSGTAPTFARNPRLAGRDPAARVARIAALQAWRAEYAQARAAWLAGNRDVLFPHGAYGLPRFHGARSHPPNGPPLLARS
jgi:hypothetical protein